VLRFIAVDGVLFVT